MEEAMSEVRPSLQGGNIDISFQWSTFQEIYYRYLGEE